VTDNWSEAAACKGRMRLFYAEDRFSQDLAVAICRSCAVRPDCELETRRTERPWLTYGVRAGFTQEQRRAWERD
jgi:hypothetical protein